MQRSWGRTRPGLLEEQQEACVASERKGCGGVEGRKSLGRAGHIVPRGLHGGLFPQRGRYVTRRGTPDLTQVIPGALWLLRGG